MAFSLPDLSVGMVVTTPFTTLPHISPNRRYVITKLEQDMVWVENDYKQEYPYKAIHFIEVDVYFALLLYTSLMRILNLTDKPYKSLDN